MKHGASYAVVFVLLIIGFFSYERYGIAWDEFGQRDIGYKTYDKITGQRDELSTFKDKDYGVALELPLVFLENTLGYTDSQDIYLMRHIVAHILFLLGGLCFYFLLYYIYQKPLLALGGLLIYVMHPVLYAHSFFNTKDIPLMSFFVVCMLALWNYHRKNGIFHLLLLSTCCSVLINLRLSGLFFVAIVSLYFLLDFFAKRNWKVFLSHSTIFFSTLCLLVWMMWPYLWEHPIANFIDAFKSMTSFRWEGETNFMGMMTPSTKLPMCYIPVWIVITNSIVITIFFSIGCVLLIIYLVKNIENKSFNARQKFLWFSLLLIILTLTSILILKPVLYDAWRQFFYLYPFFLIVALFPLSRLYSFKKGKVLTFIILGYVVIHYGLNIVSLFPYSHIYFNEVMNKQERNWLRHHYELDYWGTAYKEAFERILKEDMSNKIKIKVHQVSGNHNLFLIDPDQRNRIEFVSENEDYFVTCYRFHPLDFDSFTRKQLFYEIERSNNVICTVFKRTPTSDKQE